MTRMDGSTLHIPTNCKYIALDEMGVYDIPQGTIEAFFWVYKRDAGLRNKTSIHMNADLPRKEQILRCVLNSRL